MRERAAFIIVFASLVITTLPALLRMPFRKTTGTLVADVERIKREVPASEPLALVTKQYYDAALFAQYYLYPRRTRIYAGLRKYREADVTTRPERIVFCDYDNAHVATYGELRAEEIGATRVMRGALEAAPAKTFIVPFVASLEGPVNDRYVTEADFEGSAPLTMTLMPFGITKVVPPHSSFSDLVYEVFKRTDAGWLRVESDQRVRAAFWLVNRGRNEGIRIPLVTSARSGTLRCPTSDCVLRLVNFSDHVSNATVNGATVVVPPNGMSSQPLSGEANVSGENIYAFAGTRGGKMEIAWP